ncbi:MAG: hypothetical protein ACI4PO_03915 [Faecousia sp.]
MEIEMHTIKARLTFTEEILGTASNNPEIHSEYIASKAQDAKKLEEEVEAIGVEEVIEKSMTVFPRNEEGAPILWDYQVKGFFKDAAGVLKRVPGTKASKIKAYKKEIDGLLFVFPRKIPLNMPAGLGSCERPLRASTAQGERIALSNSETAPAGTTIDIEIRCMTKEMYDLARECLDYGALRGIGQWRNSGKGRLVWQELDDDGNVIGGNYDSLFGDKHDAAARK